MNLAKLLLRAAQSDPERPAIRLGESVVSDYGRLYDRAGRLAGALKERFALAPGERVALIQKNNPAYLECLYACWIAGLAAVPMNAKLHPREFAFMVENSGASLCLASRALAEALAPALEGIGGLKAIIDVESREYEGLLDAEPLAPADTSPEDMAWLFYTSGTTGRPKGAMLSHRNLMAMTLCYFADVDSIGPDECILHAAPMSHGSGLYILPYITQGACQVIPESSGFEADEIFSLLPKLEKVGMFAAPTMVKRLVDAAGERDIDHRNLKTVVYGGAPMYVADIKQALARFGPVFVQIYGQGESPMTITALSRREIADSSHPRYEERLASVGRAQTAIEVRIADAEDRTLPTGEVGEVLARGDSVISGYWRNPEASAKTLAGGWLHTGDMGSLDADGYLTLKDRSKDVIISGGTNIYPREVEEVLLQHERVAEVSVIGIPHPEWGEEVAAFVVPKGAPPDEEALDALCLANIARFKRPKRYVFLEALPKNNYGKVLKTELRERAQSMGGSSS